MGKNRTASLFSADFLLCCYHWKIHFCQAYYSVRCSYLFWSGSELRYFKQHATVANDLPIISPQGIHNVLYSAPQGLLPFLQEGEVGETRLTLLLQVVYQSAGCNTLGTVGSNHPLIIFMKTSAWSDFILIGAWNALGSEQWIWPNYFNSISCLNFTTSIRKTGYSRRTGIMNQSSVASPDLLEALVGLNTKLRMVQPVNTSL